MCKWRWHAVTAFIEAAEEDDLTLDETRELAATVFPSPEPN